MITREQARDALLAVCIPLSVIAGGPVYSDVREEDRRRENYENDRVRTSQTSGKSVYGLRQKICD